MQIVFCQCFQAPEGRKVGLIKRRVRSHLARWEMKNCTQLWREAELEFRCSKNVSRRGAKHISKSKVLKKWPVRSTFGSWDVQKVHGIVARSTLRYIILPYLTLPYIALDYVALHCILTLHYIKLHYITFGCITLHYIILRCITFRYFALHYITLRYITLPYLTLHYIALQCMLTLHYIALQRIAFAYLHYIMLRYVTLH